MENTVREDAGAKRWTDDAGDEWFVRYSNAETIKGLRVSLPSHPLIEGGVNDLEAIAKLTHSAGYETDRIRIDLSVVRGLEYYTGPVFEADLTFETPGEDGKPIRFGSVGGGGRYDGLVGRFRGEDVPATGFSIGVSRLFAALTAIKSPVVMDASAKAPVVVLVLDRPEIARYQGLVTRLREAKIPAELYLGQAGMNAQLKYADKRGAVCAVIQGSNERDHSDGPQVVVRDLVLGAELAKATKDRADYLELRARAQSAVAEADLVSKVLEVLARHQAGQSRRDQSSGRPSTIGSPGVPLASAIGSLRCHRLAPALVSMSLTPENSKQRP